MRFPYAVLEVKLSGTNDFPDWVVAMIRDCRCVQVHKFSKYQHALAFLHQDKAIVAPHWYTHFLDLAAAEREKEERRAAAKTLQEKLDWDEDDALPAKVLKKIGDNHEIRDMALVYVFANIELERIFQ